MMNCLTKSAVGNVFASVGSGCTGNTGGTMEEKMKTG
jgi:hypothetical protein